MKLLVKYIALTLFLLKYAISYYLWISNQLCDVVGLGQGRVS